MDLRDLLSVLRARWVVIVVAAVVGALLALTGSLLTTPSYTARIQFYVTVSGGETAAAAYQGSLGAQQKVQSYAALVDSTDVAQRVVEASGVDLDAGQVVNGVTAEADAKTVLLDVAVTDADPNRSLRLAEGYGEVLPSVIADLETPEGAENALAKLTVINPATLPDTPVSPNTTQNIFIGTILGLIVGMGTVLLAHLLDRRVREKGQVELITRAPVVGSIPFRRREDREDGAEHIVPFREGHSPVAEAFRRLRTNLQFLQVDNPPRVIVLTSSVALEGKSETAVNLSLALAEAGSRVLLVEADLRRPRVVAYMSMPDKVGLTNVLTGQAEFSDVVQGTRHAGVDLLACGPLPPNPSELLSSEVARKLFSQLRGLYDYVIIDSPPLLPVTDGALLAQISDGALLVVRSHRTTTDQLTQAVDNLEKANAQLLGTIVIANKPEHRGSSSYYNSYYYASEHKAVTG